MGDAELEETGYDDGKTVALECPAEAFSDFGAGVEHGADKHETCGHASFRGAKEET